MTRGYSVSVLPLSLNLTSTGSRNAEITHTGQSCFSISDPVRFLVLFLIHQKCISSVLNYFLTAGLLKPDCDSSSSSDSLRKDAV